MLKHLENIQIPRSSHFLDYYEFYIKNNYFQIQLDDQVKFDENIDHYIEEVQNINQQFRLELQKFSQFRKDISMSVNFDEEANDSPHVPSSSLINLQLKPDQLQNEHDSTPLKQKVNNMKYAKVTISIGILLCLLSALLIC